MYRIYEVQNGETLASIAAKLGISPEVLATLNGISLGATLNPNTYIVIPSGNTMFDRYVIKDGDTMYSIASSYGVDPMQLLRLNGMNESDIIYPNQEILVPKSNTGFYVTMEGDTINGVTRMLRRSITDIIRDNSTIYLLPDQLIVYKK